MKTRYEIIPDEKIVNLYIGENLINTFYIDHIFDKVERTVIINNIDITAPDSVNLTIFVDAKVKTCE